MSAAYTFTATPEQLPAIQMVVKNHNLRFGNNPAKWLDQPRILVTVEGDQVDRFNTALDEIRQIIDPVAAEISRTSLLTRMVKALRLS
jgi:hypothetical protein